MKIKLTWVFCFFSFVISVGQKGIGTNTPDKSAVLELKSTKKGFLPTRMTEVQMHAINKPAEGLLVYCTNCLPKGIYMYDGEDFFYLMKGIKSSLTPDITSLNCSNKTVVGSLIEKRASGSATVTIPYIGGNGETL